MSASRISPRFASMMLALFLLPGCKRREPETASASSPIAEVGKMLEVENRISALTPFVEQLGARFTANQLAFDQVAARHLTPEVKESHPLLREVHWISGARQDGPIWRDLIESFSHVDQASFSLIDGEFPEGEAGPFHGLVTFEGRGLDQEQRDIAITATQTLVWQSDQLRDWIQGPIITRSVAAPFFRERLDDVLAEEDFLRAHKSVHEQHLIDLLTKDEFTHAKERYNEYNEYAATHQHPALAVVDYNQDGWDDLYVMTRWGRNQLLHNNGDGTFHNTAPEMGLDLDGLCTSAIFADFDNDGDPDVFIGRSLERSVFLRNENGRYVDRSTEVISQLPLPYLVSSVSAVDYDQDGLLDLYLSLASPSPSHHAVKKWASEFFRTGMAAEIVRRSKDAHPSYDRLGPPNLLLRNQGHRFTIAPCAGEIAGWHSTTQVTWCDYDNDGDPDVYLCNEFAPDQLFRNDGPPADTRPRFFEISTHVMQGIGRGATWGDLDRDGRLDLYVSNIFCEVGERILGTVLGMDDRIAAAAAGNLILHNTADGWQEKARTLGVHQGGWSHGSQFADFDNDGWLDLYCPSGFYTAPDEVPNTGDRRSLFWRALAREDPHKGNLFRSSRELEISTMTGLKLQKRERRGRDSLGGSQHNRLFLNLNGERFVDASPLSGADDPGDARSMVVFDYNHDGLLDIATINANSPQLLLFENKIPARHNHVLIRLTGANNKARSEGSATNRDGYGAKIQLKCGSQTYLTEHRCGEGLAAQNSSTIHIGIGSASEIDQLTITWPGAETQTFHQLPVNHLIEVTQNAKSPTITAYR